MSFYRETYEINADIHDMKRKNAGDQPTRERTHSLNPPTQMTVRQLQLLDDHFEDAAYRPDAKFI